MSTIDANHSPKPASEERSDAWFRALMEQSPLSTQVFAPDGRTIKVNRAWEALWGVTLEAVADYNVLVDPQLERLGLAPYIRRGFAGEAVHIPAAWYDPNQTLAGRSDRSDPRRWVRAFIHPIRNQAGEISEVVLIHEDMTEQKLAEEAHEQSQRRLQMALEAGRMGVWEWNLGTNELWWSDNLEPIHGLPPGSFDGTFEGFAQVIHPEDRPRMAAAVHAALERGGHYEAEFRIVWPDGSIHWMAGKGKVFGEADGQPARMLGVGMDVTARREAEAERDRLLVALQESEEQFRGIVEHSIAGVAEVDLDGRFLFANERYCEIVGRPLDELLQLTMPQVSHRDELPENMRLFDRIRQEGTPYTIEKRYVRPDGSHVWVNNSVSGLRDRDGRLKAIVAVCVDITDRRRAEEALREADRRKTEFLATLAHELRNPLAPIMNGLQILQMAGSDAAAQGQARAVMERQLNQLVRLVDDLLDISRITRNRLELRRERIELAGVIENALETSQPFIEPFGHAVTVRLPERAVYLDGDATRLAQVFANLLTNAAKYTDPGGRIELSAQVVEDRIAISVRDSGIGIAPQHLPTLFEMFSQVTSALERSAGGLGIGLALVRGLVQMHGGDVEVRSEGLGRGSEFIVRLPLLAAEPDANAATTAPRATPASRRRVLVVDDNVDSAATLSALLRHCGHDTHMAHDGPAALDAAAGVLPDVMLLDIGMPRMNGYEVARYIRQQPWGERVTLVAVTGWGQEEDKREARNAGFDHHLTKPVDIAELRAILSADRPGWAAGRSAQTEV